MSLAEQITRHYGGNWNAGASQGNIPGDGHSKADRSVSVKDAPDKPDGILVCVRGSGDWRAEMDRFRRDGLLPKFEPRSATNGQHGPMFGRRARSPGVTYFEFHDAHGVTVCRKVRTDAADDKTFAWQHPDGKGGWKAGRGCDPLPYRLPSLLAAPEGEVIYVAEGERKADKLAAWGLVATSSKDLPADLSVFRGRTVVIMPDNDENGERIANKLQADLEGIAELVVKVILPGLPPKGDIVDWTGTADQLRELTSKALAGEPADPLPGLCGPETWDGTTAPHRSFVVPGWIARGSAGLLGGEDGVGKSLLAQQMASCAAAGVPFLGLDIPRIKALYITCEDDQHELQRRQESINRTLDVTMASLKGWLQCCSLKGQLANELATFSSDGRMSATARYEQLRQLALAFGAQLVFIDNAAHVFPGNENARHDVAAFLGLLERLSIEIDGAAVLLAHPNKQHSQGNKQGNEYSGSTGWSAHVRNRLFLDWEGGDAPNPDGRVLRRSKANYASKGEEIEFIWHDWAFTRLDDLSPSFASQIRDVARANGENDAFLRCLAAATASKRAVSHNPGVNYAPAVFAKMPEGKGHSVKTFQSAFERLLHLGAIALDQPLWRGPNRVMKQGIKAAEICTDPPAPTPCTDPHDGTTQTTDIPCTDPHASTPLISKDINGAASRPAAPYSEADPEDGERSPDGEPDYLASWEAGG